LINQLPYDVYVRVPSISQNWLVPARSYVKKQVSRIAGNKQVQFEVLNTDGGKEYMNGFYGTFFLNLDDKEGAKRTSLYIGPKSEFVASLLGINYLF